MSDGLDKRILSLAFNGNAEIFSVALTNGLRVYSSSPLKELHHIGSEVVGSIRLAAVLDASNLIAFVSGGRNPKYQDNLVCLYDCSLRKVFKLLVFSQPVLSIKMSNSLLIVVLRNLIKCFSIPEDEKSEFENIFTFETQDNPIGITAVCTATDNSIMAIPGRRKGSIDIVNLSHRSADSSCPLSVAAHQHDLACMKMDSGGKLLATASRQGTLIRVFSTDSREQVAEFRRGSDSAAIYSIAFSHDSKYLCASSDKGTVHIFALSEMQLNRKSLIRGTGNVLSLLGEYTESMWSFASFTVAHELPCHCAFVPNSPLPSVIALSANGSYYKYSFTKDGVCQLQSYDLFLEVCADHELWAPS